MHWLTQTEDADVAILNGLEVKQVEESRGKVLQDVMKLYADQSICDYRLAVQFSGEAGLDFGGLTEDLFSSFWEATFDTYFEGDANKVPSIAPHQMSSCKAEVHALGRVLEHGWRLTKKLPVRLCEASLIAMLHGEDAVPVDVLDRSFLLFVSQFERDILCAAMEGTHSSPVEYQVAALMGLYQRFEIRCAPATTETKLQEHIHVKARSEFIFKPSCVLSWMRSGIDQAKLVSFKQSLPVNKIRNIYSELSPTNHKVTEHIKLECEDMGPEQQ